MHNTYKEVSLEQNSDAWHVWRFEGIGASDAPAILNCSPFKTAAALLHQKRNRVRTRMNSVMLRGLALEPLARDAYAEFSGCPMEPLCVESLTWVWARASLDGISADRQRMVAIKCGEATYKMARKGKVPPYYFPQLQHQLMVTGLKQVDYWCWVRGRKGILLTVARDDAYIENLREAEERFYVRMTAPD